MLYDLVLVFSLTDRDIAFKLQLKYFNHPKILNYKVMFCMSKL